MSADYTLVVTGATGFVGARTLQLAAENLPETRRAAWVRQGGSPLVAEHGSQIVVADLGDYDSVRRAAAQLSPDPVRLIHLGGYVDHYRETGDECAKEAVSVNVRGSLELVQALGRRLESVVFASTIDVYGLPDRLPISEEAPLRPKTLYAASKAAAELLLGVQLGHRQVPLAVLRFGHIYGPGDRSTKIIPTFARNALAGRAPRVLVCGGRSSTRDLVFVDDAVQAILAAAVRKAQGCYNIGSGQEASVLQVAELVAAWAGVGPPITDSAPEAEITHLVLAIDRAREALGYEPRTLLGAGIATYLEAVKSGSWRTEQ